MKRFFTVTSLFLLIPSLVFSISMDKRKNNPDSWYEFGSQMFNIFIGTEIPVTYTSFADGVTSVGPWMPYSDGTSFSVGGKGSISYQIFLNSYVALGGELGYQFNFAKNYDLLTFVPIQAKATFILFEKNKFEIPLSLSLGGTYISFNSYSKFTLSCGVEAGLKYYFLDSWGFGITVGYDCIPEFYFNKSVNGENKSSVLTGLPIYITFTYRS